MWQEWLNPAVAPPAADADNGELLNKLAEGNEHITMLQAQLQVWINPVSHLVHSSTPAGDIYSKDPLLLLSKQAQNEELKVAKGQAAEGTTELLQQEEVEEENSRLKKDMESLPVLQKELEKMKRELESVTVLQKELETLRSAVTELKLSSGTNRQGGMRQWRRRYIEVSKV